MSRFFGKVCQNGYVVRDIEAALKHWTEVLGVGPFYYIDRVACDLPIQAIFRSSSSSSATMRPPCISIS